MTLFLATDGMWWTQSSDGKTFGGLAALSTRLPILALIPTTDCMIQSLCDEAVGGNIAEHILHQCRCDRPRDPNPVGSCSHRNLYCRNDLQLEWRRRRLVHHHEHDDYPNIQRRRSRINIPSSIVGIEFSVTFSCLSNTDWIAMNIAMLWRSKRRTLRIQTIWIWSSWSRFCDKVEEVLDYEYDYECDQDDRDFATT